MMIAAVDILDQDESDLKKQRSLYSIACLGNHHSSSARELVVPQGTFVPVAAAARNSAVVMIRPDHSPAWPCSRIHSARFSSQRGRPLHSAIFSRTPRQIRWSSSHNCASHQAVACLCSQSLIPQPKAHILEARHLERCRWVGILAR